MFAAGADIKEMNGLGFSGISTRPTDLADACDALARSQGGDRRRERLRPGGGCEVALTADFRFAAEDATFGQPEILLGVIPGAGGTQRLPRLVGPSRAKEMIYSGASTAPPRAEAMGLVDEVHPAAEVYSGRLRPPPATPRGRGWPCEAAKQVIDGGLEAGIDAGLLLERQAFSRCSPPRTRPRAWPRSWPTAPARRPSGTASRRPERVGRPVGVDHVDDQSGAQLEPAVGGERGSRCRCQWKSSTLGGAECSTRL